MKELFLKMQLVDENDTVLASLMLKDSTVNFMKEVHDVDILKECHDQLREDSVHLPNGFFE